MENTISGGADQAATEAKSSTAAVESLPPSRPQDKRRTTKTSKLTPEAVLEILSDSFHLAEEAGFRLVVSNNINSVTVTILKAQFIDGGLVPQKA